MEENRFLKHEKVQLEVVFFIAFMVIHNIEIFRPCDQGYKVFPALLECLKHETI